MREKKEKMLLIQTLRGIATLMVLFHHTNFIMENKLDYLSSILKQGWIGVDFFFVLSGFIIFYINYNDIGKKGKIKEFYLKRFIRVYPIYWVITLGVIILSFLIPGLLYSYRIDFIIKSVFLFPQTTNPIVIVGWTLVYEIFFYFLFGLSILLKPRYSIPLCLLWVVGIFLNSFHFIIFKYGLFWNFVFSNNNIEFIIGCIAAYITVNIKIKHKVSVMLLGILGASIGWGMLVNGNIQRYFTESVLILGFSFGFIVLSAASFDLYQKQKVPKFLLLLGDASYSIYLTHYYILGAFLKTMKKITILNPSLILMVVSILAILLGIEFHKIIEIPLLKYLNSKWLRKSNQFQIHMH